MSTEISPSRELDAASIARSKAVALLPAGSHIHISGVCGTGTASVLTLLKSLGYRVTGSDKAFYPPMGDVVRKEADKVFEGYSADNLSPRPALVVIGNALSRSNPEVEYVLANDIPFASMPEVFSALLIGSRDDCPTSVVVSGTHGKTTTSAAAAALFESAGRKPGFFVGGMPKNFSTSIRPVDKSIAAPLRVVVLEGDEYDSAFFAKYSKFHSYRPDIALVTSLEFDHADIYNSIEEIENEFTKFVARVPKTGAILVADSGEHLEPLTAAWEKSKEISARILRYGEKPSSQFRLLKREIVNTKSAVQALQFNLDGKELRCETQLSGAQNAWNLLAVAAIGRLCGLNDEQIKKGIADFSGVLRRQNVIADKNGILVIEDFAHHPTAVQLTLEGLKEQFPGRRLIAVFEPRSNTSRRNFFQDAYAKSFGAADEVIIRKVADPGGYSGTSSEVVALDVDKIVSELQANRKAAAALASIDEIVAKLATNAKRGDLIVLMSNGDFGNLPKLLPAAL